ncbi:hypothetical protein P8452_52231 [Trifolium repens]|nr:hypothetical protein P8452_52231 [Trifolium repens]
MMHASNINIQNYQQLQEDQDTKQLLLHFNNNNSQTLPPRPTAGGARNNNNSSSSSSSSSGLLETGAFRVKATFADEKIFFSLQVMCGFRDLQLEIARRFNLNDMNNLVLKYLDDEGKCGLYYHVMLILKNVKTCTHLLTHVPLDCHYFKLHLSIYQTTSATAAVHPPS